MWLPSSCACMAAWGERGQEHANSNRKLFFYESHIQHFLESSHTLVPGGSEKPFALRRNAQDRGKQTSGT